MRSIPKKLLIHEAVHAVSTDSDRWGTETLVNRQKIDNIRIEPTEQIIRDKNNAEIQLAATLFYDCRNSRPKGMAFAVDDIILVNEEMYKVQVCEPLYDAKKMHHWELGLVRHA